MLRSVYVALKVHAVVVHIADLGQRENLVAAGIGENRALPAHEVVEATELRHEIVPRPQVQVIGIGQHHLCAQRVDLLHDQALHGALGAHRHERGREYDPVRGFEYSRAGRTLVCLQAEFEHGA